MTITEIAASCLKIPIMGWAQPTRENGPPLGPTLAPPSEC